MGRLRLYAHSVICIREKHRCSCEPTADFLTNAGFMLTFGQILAIAPTKWVYLVAIAIFEIGSLM